MDESITSYVGLDAHAESHAIGVADAGQITAPRFLMGYLGLVPSEHSSGQKRSLGAITKTGNPQVRRMLIEAAWNYRFPPASPAVAETPRRSARPDPRDRLAAQLRLTTAIADSPLAACSTTRSAWRSPGNSPALSGASASRSRSGLDHIHAPKSIRSTRP